MGQLTQGMPDWMREHFEGKPEKGTTQARELFCRECRKVMVFHQEFTNTYTYLMPWICVGCGAKLTL